MHRLVKSLPSWNSDSGIVREIHLCPDHKQMNQYMRSISDSYHEESDKTQKGLGNQWKYISERVDAVDILGWIMVC